MRFERVVREETKDDSCVVRACTQLYMKFEM